MMLLDVLCQLKIARDRNLLDRVIVIPQEMRTAITIRLKAKSPYAQHVEIVRLCDYFRKCGFHISYCTRSKITIHINETISPHDLAKVLPRHRVHTAW